MRYYLKSGRRAALMLFRRGSDFDYERVDKIDAHNSALMQEIYNGLMSGTMSAAYITVGTRRDIYTKSLRGDFVQVSHFCKFRGDWEATGHGDAYTGKAMADGAMCGHYINVQ